MRKHGTLTKWNDDRGFGFISPSGGAPDVFVHISAFPRDGRRPQTNELISFETEAGPGGRQRAVRIMRPGQAPALPRSASTRGTTHREIRRPRATRAAGLVAIGVAALGAYAYDHFVGREPPVQEPADVLSLPLEETAPPQACDGRTMCSQMKSCVEATYFIRNCPNTQMDGDHDGVPCEQQWCN